MTFGDKDHTNQLKALSKVWPKPARQCEGCKKPVTSEDVFNWVNSGLPVSKFICINCFDKLKASNPLVITLAQGLNNGH